MKILIAGFGSIGRRHLQNIKQLMPQAQVALMHHSPADHEQPRGTVKAFTDLPSALAWKPQVVFVTNPAPFHISTATAFAKINADLFIEKPLSISMEGTEALTAECDRRKLVCMVGYVLRFSKPLRLLKEWIETGRVGKVLSLYAHVGRYLPQWRQGTDYRRGVSARKDMGGGVVLELSHELDYARWLIGNVSSVGAAAGHITDFEIDVEDIAEVNLHFANGAIGHIHLDMFDHAPHRGCRIIGSRGTLVWENNDGIHSVRLFDGESQQWEDVFEGSLEPNEMYVNQMNHFFECVTSRAASSIDLPQGREALTLALAIQQSVRERKEIEL